tara:strand:- start:4682 stop:5227 length:546 start_codon:yes stop_codon:yes gene_type:complete
MKLVNNIVLNLLSHPTKSYRFRDVNTIDTIVIHQTDTEDRGAFSPYEIAQYHVNSNDWPSIGYHYFVIEDGTIYKTNDENRITYHASGFNEKSLGVAITGLHRCNASDDNYQILNKEKYNALVFILAKLSNKYNIDVNKVIGHTETGSPKSCPNLNMVQLRSDVEKKKFNFYSQRVLSLSY